MNKRFLSLSILLATFLINGCGKVEQLEEQVNSSQNPTAKTTLTEGVLGENYQALLENGSYKMGIANQVETSRLNSNYNQNNFETGLLRLANSPFPMDAYVFQEGQKLDGLSLKQWLNRKSTDNPQGLNPEDVNRPLGIQKILEYDFYHKKDEKFAGMVVGIALNTVDYTKNPPQKISMDEMLNQGRQSANSVLTRIRQIPELKKIPVYLALFQQAEKEDVAGGHFIYGALSEHTATIDKWKPLEENYYLLPTTGDNEALKDGTNDAFVQFKNKTLSFFPNLIGVSGLAHYVKGDLMKLTIDVQSGYYSKSEIISFTQFISKNVEESFDEKMNVEITVNSVKGPQSYVIKNPGASQPIAHIFN